MLKGVQSAIQRVLSMSIFILEAKLKIIMDIIWESNIIIQVSLLSPHGGID